MTAGVGCHFLLQGIFPPRDGTLVFSIAGGFFTTEHLLGGLKTLQPCTIRNGVSVHFISFDQLEQSLLMAGAQQSGKNHFTSTCLLPPASQNPQFLSRPLLMERAL